MGLPKEKPRTIRGARSDYSRQWHHNNEGRGTPEECGEWVHMKMQEEWGERYPAEIALEDCIKAGIKSQETALRRAKSHGDDLLGDPYLEAPAKDTDGDFVKMKNTTSDYHDSEREHEIVNQSRVTSAFNRSEDRRKQLKSVGLWETPGMTTGQAAWKVHGSSD